MVGYGSWCHESCLGSHICKRMCKESRFAIVAALSLCYSKLLHRFLLYPYRVLSLQYHEIFLLHYHASHYEYVLYCCYTITLSYSSILIILLLLLHCTAVPVHTTLVYCSAVSAAIPLHFYTMILLYPLEYLSSAGVHSSLSK